MLACTLSANALVFFDQTAVTVVAFGASLITELRQLGGVLGVAVTTLVLTTVNGTALRENDAGMVAGFSAAVFVAAALCGLAAAFTAWRMPAETATQPVTR